MTESKMRVKTLFKSLSAHTSSLYGDELAVLSGEIRLKPIAMPAVMDCCISMVCESGSAYFADEMGSYHLTPMTALFFMPGHLLTDLCLSGFRGTIVLMAPSFVKDVLGHYALSLKYFLSVPKVETVPYTFVEGEEAMANLFKCICDYRSSNCRCGIVHLIRSMVSGFAPVSHLDRLFSRNTVVSGFVKLLDLDDVQVRPITYYAEKLNVSSRYLAAILKNATGRSFPKWISSAVIHRAKLLLLNPNLTIKEISYNLGFGDPSNFARYFKSYCGMTPKEFRGMMPEGRGKSILDY